MLPAFNFDPRATVTAIAVAAVSVGVAQPASAQQELGSGPSGTPALTEAGSRTYVIQFKESPAVSYRGDLAGYAATAPVAGAKYNKNSAAVRDYTAHLTATHDQALQAVGASGAKIYDYQHAINGMAARLTAAQADSLRKRADVAYVWEDYAVDVETNNSPQFLGLFDGSKGLRSGFKLEGEDVIIGIMDTGAVQEHPSFSDVKVGKIPWWCEYPENERVAERCERIRARRTKVVYGPPPERWNGICQEGEAWSADDCNNKLIGARWFSDGFAAANEIVEGDFLSPRDSSGHGSHTAATAGGNYVKAELAGIPLAEISGMAPRARIAVYKVCWLAPEATSFSCFFSDSAAATDAAVADGVDVLNFSVGTAASFTDPQDLAFLDAATAGVFIARSAGNDGPEAATTNAGEPWVTSVGASTVEGIQFVIAATVNSPASLAGEYTALEGAITQPLAVSGPVTDDVAAAEPVDACTPLTNDLGGKIALIARGACAFTDKVENAVAAGASAILMYTDDRPKTVMAGTASSTTTSVPGVMIDNAPGLAILAELQNGATVNVTLSAENFIIEERVGDIMAGFSSRGPYTVEGDWIKPDVTAPGVNILAANAPDQADGSVGGLYGYLSGTSMSGPHVAGIGALLVEARPDWSPAQIKSALMTSAYQEVFKEDGETPADPFDFGAGHISPNNAVNPGLTYDVGQLDYLAASCGTVTPLLSPADCDFVANTLGLSTDPANLNLPLDRRGRSPRHQDDQANGDRGRRRQAQGSAEEGTETTAALLRGRRSPPGLRGERFSTGVPRLPG